MSKAHPLTMEILERIVTEDEKQRYSFNEDKTLIRANQGHSIPVDVELKELQPPEFLYHGTVEKYVESIDKQGLIPKSRLYVHLSSDEDTVRKVGSRHGKPVIYIVKSGEMYRNHGYYSQSIFRKVFSCVFCTKIRGSSAPNATEGSICVHFVAMNSGAVNSNKSREVLSLCEWCLVDEKCSSAVFKQEIGRTGIISG